MTAKADFIKHLIGQIETLCQNKEDTLLFLRDELSRQSGQLFTDSKNNTEAEFYLSIASNIDYWNKALSIEKNMGINVEAYRQNVMIWADMLPKRSPKKKKTPRGWIATGRQFMKIDKENSKLMLLNRKFTSDEADYLTL